jgi:SAM-dependent methyltransferase
VHVLHLIPAWQRAVAEVRRVLAPGGVLLTARRIWERSEGRGPRARARERHSAILAEMGHRSERVGARTDREVIDAFAGLGGRVEELAPIGWQEDETWAEYLEVLERRVSSDSWRVPGDAWREGVRRLRAELDDEGVDLHAPITTVRHVDLAAIRF